MQGQCERGAKVPGRTPKDAAGKVGSVLDQELLRVAFTGIFEVGAGRCDAHHSGDIFFGLAGAAPKASDCPCPQFRTNGQLHDDVAPSRASETAARAHTKWGPASLPTPTIRCRSSRFRHGASWSADLATDSPKRRIAARAGTIRRRFGRPPFGGRPHLESPSSSCPSICRSGCSYQAMDCFPEPDRVHLNSWESRCSVIRLSVDFLVGPIRSLPAGLATTLDVPAVRRLCRPMIGSCHEAPGQPTKKRPFHAPERPPLWISPALATWLCCAAFLYQGRSIFGFGFGGGRDSSHATHSFRVAHHARPRSPFPTVPDAISSIRSRLFFAPSRNASSISMRGCRSRSAM